jgi:hypothetical protein
MAYRVVFEAREAGFLPVWAIIAILLVGLCAFWFGKRSLKQVPPTKETQLGGLFNLTWGILAVTFSVLIMQGDYRERRFVRNALRNGDFSVVEGTVSDFVPMPPGGHAVERFTVNGHHFNYGYDGGRTFSSSDNQGFIRNGAWVRITYKDDKILRVEVPLAEKAGP